MPTSTLTWTVLPRGLDDAGDFVATVFVSPQLVANTGNRTVGDYPEFVDWPATLDSLRFRLIFNGAEGSAATMAHTADSAVWRAAVPATTSVAHSDTESHARSLARRSVMSYPVLELEEFFADRYSDLAVNASDSHPPASDLGGANRFGPLGARRDKGSWAGYDPQADVEANGFLPAPGPTPPKGSPEETAFHLRNFAALDHYFRPLPAGYVGQAIERPTLDFHRVVSAAGRHPVLLRRLGLAFDVRCAARLHTASVRLDVVTGEVPPNDGARDRGAPDDLERPPTPAVLPSVEHRLPTTRLVAGRTREPVFRAASREGDSALERGFLDLADADRYGVSTLDVDGAAFKAFASAEVIASRSGAGERAPFEVDTATVGTVRSEGIAIVNRHQGRDLRRLLETSVKRAQRLGTNSTGDGADLHLFAEDLVRGIRVDVFDGLWRSLHQRRGRIEVGRDRDATQVVIDADEGFSSTATRLEPDVDSLAVSERLAVWKGWSLSVPPPGDMIAVEPDEHTQVETPDTEPGPDDPPITPRYQVMPGSLPPLRYGSRYRLRARTVDLAGNSLAIADETSQYASPTIVYGRHEAIQSPPALLHDAPTAAESVEVAVVRSRVDDVGFDHELAQRHLVPPKIAQRHYEWCGGVDNDDGTVDRDAHAALAERDAWRFDKDGDGVELPDGSLAFPTGDGALDVGYLCDPMAAGIAIKGLPGSTGDNGVDTVEYSVDPGRPFRLGDPRRPIRLRVVRGDGPPDIDQATGFVTVQIPIGTRHEIQVSSLIRVEDVPRFVHFQWAHRRGLDLAPFEGPTTRGQNWLLTPWRTMTLVHATQVPVAAPAFYKALDIARADGETTCRLSGLVELHRPSTLQLDVRARWLDQVDNGPGTGLPDIALQAGEVGSGPVPRTDTALRFDPARDDLGPDELVPLGGDVVDAHEFRDTKRRLVAYSLVATSPYKAFFAETVAASNDKKHVLNEGEPVVPGSVVVRDSNGRTLIEGTHYTIDVGAGEVTFLGVTSTRGRTIEFVPDRITRAGTNTRAVDIPASARPAAPVLREVVPASRWETHLSADATTATHTRRANTLRVYLERPWFTSGKDEQLAVCCAGPGATVADVGALEELVTQWGQDPVRMADKLPSSFPSPAAFVNRDGTAEARLPGRTDTVSLALYDVKWASFSEISGVGVDGSDDGLYYVDMELDPGTTYAPFVRLVLARHQDHAVSDLHLSGVVQSSFMPLLPDRSTGVDRARNGITAYFDGVSYLRTAAADGRTSVIARLQRFVGPDEIAGTDHGWETLREEHLEPATTGEGKSILSRRFPPGGTNGERLRVVFEERETHLVDDKPDSESLSRFTAPRPVFTDVIELPAVQPKDIPKKSRN